LVSAIVLAGGMGKRMGSKVSKQYLKLCGKPVLYYSIKAFDEHPKVEEIVVVIRSGEEEIFEKEIFSKYRFRKKLKIVRGGEERSDSVGNGLLVLDNESEIVLIHDGVRPFLDGSIIDRNIEVCIETGACITGVASKDTVKVVDSSMDIVETPDRSLVFLAQTPQTFRREVIVEAIENVKCKGLKVTDDSMAVERLGVSVRVVEGSYENIKLTTPEDMISGEEIAKKRGY
jgi:2-C-methyl-D-erythritol 4-phosphate cytidylyltransferase